jgi:hypothetical protein
MQINRIFIRLQFDRLLKRYSFNSYILWIGTPTASTFIDIFKPELIVYHAVDRYSEFPFVDKNKILSYEEKVAQKANIILCTSDAIKADLVKYNKAIHTVTHAVDFEHFHSVVNKIPDDIKHIEKPIIGYFGGLSERVNFNLLTKIAVHYPHVSIVLIGKKLTDIRILKKYPNVHILGYKDFNSLPNYLSQFSVCLIPYHVNELMKGVDPIKLREYLCLGKPVVSVDLPEVRKLKNLVYIGKNEHSFIMRVGEALNEKDDNIREQRIRATIQDNWFNKMNKISSIINNYYPERRLHI